MWIAKHVTQVFCETSHSRAAIWTQRCFVGGGCRYLANAGGDVPTRARKRYTGCGGRAGGRREARFPSGISSRWCGARTVQAPGELVMGLYSKRMTLRRVRKRSRVRSRSVIDGGGGVPLRVPAMRVCGFRIRNGAVARGRPAIMAAHFAAVFAVRSRDTDVISGPGGARRCPTRAAGPALATATQAAATSHQPRTGASHPRRGHSQRRIDETASVCTPRRAHAAARVAVALGNLARPAMRSATCPANAHAAADARYTQVEGQIVLSSSFELPRMRRRRSACRGKRRLQHTTYVEPRLCRPHHVVTVRATRRFRLPHQPQSRGRAQPRVGGRPRRAQVCRVQQKHGTPHVK